jgi:uncharacterized Zn finger protein
VDVTARTLRCHSCSHSVAVTVEPMRLVGLFKASLVGRVPPTKPNEVRKRCTSCGWVNIFHPVDLTRAREIVVK